MRTLIVPNDFVELVLGVGIRPSYGQQTACKFVSTCAGLSCPSCQANEAPAETIEEARQFFVGKGHQEARKSAHLVRIRSSSNPATQRTLCHWTVQCPRDGDLNPTPCSLCPAEGRMMIEVGFEEAVARWEEAKLIRRYR